MCGQNFISHSHSSPLSNSPYSSMTSFLKPSCLAHPIREKLDMIGFLYITIFILLVVIANNDHEINHINEKIA